MKNLFLVAGVMLAGNVAYAQIPADMKKLPSGISYKIVKDVPGNPPAKGDFVQMHFVTKSGDKVLQESRAMGPEPQMAKLGDPQFAGDPIEVISMLSVGDSAVIVVPGDSLRKKGIQLPEDIKTLDMYVSVTGTKTEAQVQADQAKLQEEMQKKAAAQGGIDDKLIQDYLAKNKIKATKTASGLYYVITSPGTGEQIKSGQEAQVMYAGKLLNGKVFDANMGPEAKRSEPLPVPVGQGRVIRGWDEGLQLLKKGSKATFYIPSPLAYGQQAMGADIPANSVLVFDVEIKDVK